MPLSHYPHGFPNGVSIKDIPFNILTNPLAKTFWVDSNNGSNGNKGTDKAPFATIDYAVGRCTANRGDTIYVAAGHAETIITATQLVVDVAGISIIGLGNEGDRPLITFATADTALVPVNAANVRISNIEFTCHIASQAIMMDLNSERITIDNCHFREGTQPPVIMIDITGSGANVCDGIIIRNCKFYSPTAGSNEAIALKEVNNRITISDCTVWGDFANGCIANPTGKVLTDLTIANCTLTNLQTGDHAIELVSACTGVIQNVFMYTDTYATTIDPGAMACFECYSVSSVDKNARLNPVVES